LKLLHFVFNAVLPIKYYRFCILLTLYVEISWSEFKHSTSIKPHKCLLCWFEISSLRCHHSRYRIEHKHSIRNMDISSN